MSARAVVTSAQEMYSAGSRVDASFHTSPGVRVLRFLKTWQQQPAGEHTPVAGTLHETPGNYTARTVHTLAEVCVPGGIFIPSRFKRIFVNNVEHGAPYLTGSSIMQADPLEAAKFLSSRYTRNMDALALHPRMILVTCSGSIGNTVYVNANFAGAVGSPDLLRIVANQAVIPSGYLYTVLSSSLGRSLIEQKTYGAVIPHIEAHHITDLPIPRLDLATEQRIHTLIEQAAALRVAANNELNELVQGFNKEILGIPEGYTTVYPNEWSYDVRLTYLNDHTRLDPFHYVGHANEYRRYLKPGPLLQDLAYVQLPGKFKRMYVGPEGIPYLSGVDVYQIKVTPRLWLSRRQPELPELVVDEEGTILVQADGQRYGLCGRPMYVDEYVTGAALSNHLVRIRPHDPEVGGYIFLFFMTEAGRRELIRQSYGTSIPTIPVSSFKSICISSADTEVARGMGQKALAALKKRTQSNHLEDAAQALLLVALGWQEI